MEQRQHQQASERGSPSKKMCIRMFSNKPETFSGGQRFRRFRGYFAIFFCWNLRNLPTEQPSSKTLICIMHLWAGFVRRKGATKTRGVYCFCLLTKTRGVYCFCLLRGGDLDFSPWVQQAFFRIGSHSDEKNLVHAHRTSIERMGPKVIHAQHTTQQNLPCWFVGTIVVG